MATRKQIELPGSVGLDVGEGALLVLSVFLALVGVTLVRRMSSSTSGGDDVPYNIKDQL